MSVRGPVAGANLGPTLPHEHLLVDLTLQVPFSGLLNEPNLAIQEVARFAALSGQTIVDCSSNPIGRDPVGLREIAERADMHVIMGCGWYREPFMDRDSIDRASVRELAQALTDEIEDGVADTGIRPGIIGSERFITSAEERALRAAGLAAARTGLTVTTHAARWPNGLAQLTLLKESGVEASRVIIGHCDTIADSEYHLALARDGAFVQFDTIRGASAFDTARQIEFVLAMAAGGALEQVLLSHDVCLREHWVIRGGGGYAFVHGEFAQRLSEAGLVEDQIRLLLTENPRRALTGE
jgi:phosphotriesterase-related protein